ncbi:MAG: NCS2 family permease [Acidobacteriota bacterium]
MRGGAKHRPGEASISRRKQVQKDWWERIFGLHSAGSSVRTELIAGATTFVTMAYIIFVNPTILADAGMPFNAVLAATCISAAVASLVMGLYANYPIALAPGMGINAYFTYSVVKGLGLSWQTALGAVFISGVIFILLTIVRVRQLILNSIPTTIHASVAAGIGLFIAFLGLRNGGFVIGNKETFVTIGKLTEPATILAALGLIITGALIARRIRGAILIGILITTVAAIVLKLAPLPTGIVQWPELSTTFAKLDVRGALARGVFDIIFIFLFVDLFDNVGTLVAVSKQAGFLNERGELPRADRVLLADGVGTVVGAICGTSTVVSYIESAAGVSEGGRTGLTAVTVAALFALALFFAPLIGVVPALATAPALIVVGSLMMLSIRHIDWSDAAQALPAFLTMIAIPFTFSITNGLALGFISYPLMMALSGRARQVGWLVYLLALLFILRYAYLGSAG